MHVLVLQAHIVLANQTFLGLAPTVADVTLVVLEFNYLVTVLAGLGLEGATRLMPRMVLLRKLYLTVLADDLSMSLLVMLVLFILGNNFTADIALIIHSGAPDLMHPVFAHLDLTVAHATLFGWFTATHCN